MTLLSIDDDALTQMILQRALQSRFQVVTENSGARAIAAAETAQPQVILLDLSMPNVDGYEVLTQLKHHPTLNAVPVICLSGKSDEESRARAYDLGAAGFMVKPISVQTISNDVEQILSKLNTELVSGDGRKRIFIGRNSAAEHEKLRANLRAALDKGQTVVMLSFLDPESFFTDFEREMLRDERLFFLQIKPSLMARLPYLQEMASVVEDIQTLTRGKLVQTSLFVDGVERLIDVSDQARATRIGLAFGDTLARYFTSIEYYCSNSRRDAARTENLNELATVLVA